MPHYYIAKRKICLIKFHEKVKMLGTCKWASSLCRVCRVCVVWFCQMTKHMRLVLDKKLALMLMACSADWR
mgnify:FL=1